ncbi:YciI family protein [Devosia sp.]|uniref:YciI family protein n=1 Tax=Devosia sp. TaxID=1871048 RepID=UPI003A9299C0
MQFTILIYGEPGLFDRLTPERQAEVMDGHHRLLEKLHADGAYEVSARLASSATAMRLSGPAGQTVLMDGPYAETKEHFLGFYQINCADMDAALDYARIIASDTVTLEVRPVAWSE